MESPPWSASLNHRIGPRHLEIEAHQVIIGEVVPAAAGVMELLLNVARERGVGDFLTGHLPPVSDLLELFPGHLGTSSGDPLVAAAKLLVCVLREAVAKDALLGGHLARRHLI